MNNGSEIKPRPSMFNGIFAVFTVLLLVTAACWVFGAVAGLCYELVVHGLAYGRDLVG